MKKINEFIAVKGTLAFGSMWTTYLFFLYGFLPLLFPDKMETLLYWSNTVQLWSLPLLMVGQNLLSRKSEQRSQQDHKAIMMELKEIKAIREELRELKKICHSNQA